MRCREGRVRRVGRVVHAVYCRCRTRRVTDWIAMFSRWMLLVDDWLYRIDY